MSRRRRSRRSPSVIAQARTATRQLMLAEQLEIRVLLSTAFDLTGLTALRQNSSYSNIDGKGIGIAVLDTGVYAENPDLKNNVVAFYNAVEDPVDTPIDPNFLQDAVDNNGHGSHTSGIAASSNPNIGVAYGASLVDVKVIPDPGEVGLGGDPVDRGLQWVELHAAQYNIRVVNMSLGDPGVNLNYTPALDQEGVDIEQLEAMGITVVSSSGNSYAVYAAPGASLPAVESTISAANSFSDNGVGTYDFSGYFGEEGDSYFARQTSAGADVFNATSQRSTLYNQLVAPGTDILSTWNSPSQLYNTESGTSMSAPFISGTVALMQQEAFQTSGSYLQPSEVLQILRNTATIIQDPVSQPAVRAEVLADGTLGPDEPLPGTGDNYDRVNVYGAVVDVQQFERGNTGSNLGDLNNTIATATPTQPLNGATSVNVFGNIGVDGLQSGGSIVGPNDIDLYGMTLEVTGALIIDLSPVSGGTDFEPTVRLFNASGTQLATATYNGAYPSITTSFDQPLATGTYYVGVSSAGNDTYNIVNATGIAGGVTEGDYQLQVSVNNPDPRGVPAAGSPIDLTAPTTLATFGTTTLPAETVSGVVGQETDQNGDTVQLPNGDVQFFQVVAPDSGDLDVTADSDDAIVDVFDSNDTRLASDSDDETVPVTAGQTYYLGVTTGENAGYSPTNPYDRTAGSTDTDTPFDLTVAFTNGNTDGTVVQATAKTLGTPITAQIGSSGAPLGANSGNKDADFYAFTAATSGVFQATVSGSGGFTPEMALWTSTNGINGVQQLATAPSSGTPELYEQVTAGQVVVVSVTGSGNQNLNGIAEGSGAGGQTGTYTLNTALDPTSLLTTLSNNSILTGTPTPLTLDTPVEGNIGLDGDLYVGPDDVDMYSFVAATTGEYQFATDTSLEGSAQTVLRIFNTEGDQIAANQASSAISTNSLDLVPLSAGQTVYVGVSGAGPDAFAYNPLTGANAGPGSTGPYSLEVTNTGPFERTATFQQGQSAKFTDANGHAITVTLNGPGTGELIFDSTSSDANVSQIILEGTDGTSTLTIRGATTLGGISDTGALQAINARQDNLTGDLSVTSSLDQLSLASATGGHSITVGAGGRLMLNIGTLTDESLVSAETVGSIIANQWTVSTSTRQQISAPLIQNLTVRGTFDEDINATVIGHLKMGTLASSAIRASSAINSVTATTVQGSEIFVNVTPTLATLPASTSGFVAEDGSLKSILVRGAFSNTQIAAWNIGTVGLKAIQTSNGGTAFGLTADTLAHFRGVPSGGKPIILSRVFAPYNTTSLGGDAVIRIVG